MQNNKISILDAPKIEISSDEIRAIMKDGNDIKKYLPKEVYNTIHKEIAERILSTNEEKWNTIPRTYSEIDTLRNKFKNDDEKLKALEDINSYIMEIEKSYKKDT